MEHKHANSWRLLPVIIFVSVLSTLSVLFCVLTANAATTAPSTMNFQGRLTDAAGNVVANGSYNLKFTIYNASSVAVWTETRETTNRVVVTNGLFSVQLGSVSALTPSIFSTTGLTLGVTMANPATATCSTASCQSWETEMTPRSAINTSAYAFNADAIDGIDGASLAQLGVNNTFTGTQSITVTSASALSVGSMLTVDTSGSIVKVGTSGSATGGATVRLLSTAAEFTTSVRIGNATNGVDITTTGVSLRGTAQPTVKVTLAAEYSGATFTGDGTSNVGSLSSDFCSNVTNLQINTALCASGTAHNYYSWTTSEASAQDYDLYVRYQVPSDYATGSMTNLSITGWGTTTASESVTVALWQDGQNSACSTSSNAVASNATWSTATVATPLGSCNFTAGDMVTLRVRLVAANNNVARTGNISFNYKRAL